MPREQSSAREGQPQAACSPGARRLCQDAPGLRSGGEERAAPGVVLSLEAADAAAACVPTCAAPEVNPKDRFLGPLEPAPAVDARHSGDLAVPDATRLRGSI